MKQWSVNYFLIILIILGICIPKCVGPFLGKNLSCAGFHGCGSQSIKTFFQSIPNINSYTFCKINVKQGWLIDIKLYDGLLSNMELYCCQENEPIELTRLELASGNSVSIGLVKI